MRPIVVFRWDRTRAWYWRCRVHSVASMRFPTQPEALAAALGHCRSHMPWARSPVPTGRYA